MLAHIGVDYRRQLRQADVEVVVRCRLASFRRSSIRTREAIAMSNGTIAAEAEAVVVPRDTGADRARALSDAECDLLTADIERETQAEG